MLVVCMTTALVWMRLLTTTLQMMTPPPLELQDQHTMDPPSELQDQHGLNARLKWRTAAVTAI
jgi:hypothetical protein